jgi:ketosteroid isomerase-like protein
MTKARNKILVERYFDACSRGDARAISDMYAPEGVHIARGNTLFSGTYNKEQIFEISSQVTGPFPEGLKFTIDSMIAEDDIVVAEVQSNGKHISGAYYHNEYVFIMKFQNGALLEVKEYFDTEAATEVLCGGNKRARTGRY